MTYAYYNEFDPFAAAWLRELIKAGYVADGYVDERSIEDVKPDELAGFTQCHFFAGIGGWSYALRLAGWSDSEPVWTGSCPCQPFSAAGKGVGFADERHLWPTFFHLIEQRRPSIVFGEQVAGKPGLAWLELVSTDLENAGYAVGAANLGAHSVGAPHIRQRLYWVADAVRSGRAERRAVPRIGSATGSGGPDGLADAMQPRPQGWVERGRGADQRTSWANSVAVPCSDGTSRPIEPGTFPLAHGVPARVGRLRGYGNAIVPFLAAQFIKAAVI